MFAPAPAIATERPVPILSFMREAQIWKLLCRADPELLILYRQAWRATCPDWSAIYELLCELVGPTRRRPCDDPAIFALRSFDVAHDRLWDHVRMCMRPDCGRCSPLQLGHRTYKALRDPQPEPGAWMGRGRIRPSRTFVLDR